MKTKIKKALQEFTAEEVYGPGIPVGSYEEFIEMVEQFVSPKSKAETEQIIEILKDISVKTYNPTESELIEIGFESSYKVNELEYSLGRYFIVCSMDRYKFYMEPENGLCSIPVYPKSKGDILKIIELFT